VVTETGKPGRKRSETVTVLIPKELYEEAKRLNVAVGRVARHALMAFVKYDLPFLELPEGEKVRLNVRVPAEVAEKLRELGGPSVAFWFVARRLEHHIKLAKKVLSMSTEEFATEYANGGWPVDDFPAEYGGWLACRRRGKNRRASRS